MALSFTCIGIYCLHDTFYLQFSGEQATGTVTGNDLSSSSSNPFTESGKSDYLARGSYSNDAFYTQVFFRTETGKEIYFTSSSGSDLPEYNEGDKVIVYYDPENPIRAKINNEGWLLPSIFIPVGILLFFAVWKLGKLF